MRAYSIVTLLALLSGPAFALAQGDAVANRKAALAVLSDAEALAKKPLEYGGNGREDSRLSILNLIFQERLAFKDIAGAEAVVPLLSEKYHRHPALRQLALAYEREGRKDEVKRIREGLADKLKALRASTKHVIQDGVWLELARDCALAGDDEGFRRFAIEGQSAAFERGAWLAAGQELLLAGQEEAAARYFKQGWAAEASPFDSQGKAAAALTLNLIHENRQAMIPLVMKAAPRAVRLASYLKLAAHQNDWENAEAAKASFERAFDEFSAMCLAETPDAELLPSAELMRLQVRLSAVYDDQVTKRAADLVKKLEALADPAICSHGLIACAYISYGVDPSALLDRAMERAKDIKDPKGNGQAKTMVLQARRVLASLHREEVADEARAALDRARAAERERRKQLGGKMPKKPAKGGPGESARMFIVDAKAGRWEKIGKQLELESLSEGYSSQGIWPAVHQLYQAGEVTLAVKLLEVAEKAMPGDSWMNAWMILIARPAEGDDSELVNRVFAKLPMWSFIQEDQKVLEELRTLARTGEYEKARAVRAKLTNVNADALLAAELAVAQALRGDDELAQQSARIALASVEREIQGRGVRALAIVGIKQLNKGNRAGMVAWAEQYKTRTTNEYHYHYDEPRILLNRFMLADVKAGDSQKAVETEALFDRNSAHQERQKALFRVLLHCVQCKDRAGAAKALKALGDPLAVKPWTVETKLDQFGRPMPREHFAKLKLHQLLSLVLAYQKVGDGAASKHVLEFVVHQAGVGDGAADAISEPEHISEAYARRAGVEASRIWIDPLPDLIRARALVGVVRSLRPDADATLYGPTNVDISELYFH